MANIVDIIVNARDQASSVIRGIEGSVSNMADKLERNAGLMQGMAIAGAGALGVIIGKGAQYNAMLESSEARWKTLTGSIEGANKQMDFISSYAKSSPFDYQGIDETATSLMGMGMELKDVNKWIPTLGDMASVMGGGTETIKGVGVALGQMSAKGKVSAEEMGQLAERGVNAWQMIADGMGLSVGEVRKLSEEGKILASDALPMIQKGMAETFGGGTAEYMNSTVGQAQQAQEAFNELSGTLSSGVYNWFGATVLPMINSGLEKVNNLFSGGLMEGFKKLFSGEHAQTAMMIAGAIGGVLVGALAALVIAFAPAIGMATAFIAVGAGIGLLVQKIIANWSTFAPYFQTVFSIVKDYVMGFVDQLKASFANLVAGIAPLWASLKTLFESVKPILMAVGVVIGTLLTISLAVFNGIVSAIMPLVTAFVNLADFVVNVVMTIVKVLTGDWAGAMKSWERATQASIEFFKNIWNAIKGFFSGFVGTFISILNKFGIDVVSGFKSTWEKAKSAVSNGINAVVNFFKGLPSKAGSALSSLGSSIKSKFDSAINSAKQAVSNGIKNIVSAIKGWVGDFTNSGKGLLEAFTKGIKNGISGAVDAVAGGMKKIRSFLPFSPAKKGALSDLDKSGKSFFPTWYESALKQVKPMERAVGGAMQSVSNAMQSNYEPVSLVSFGGSTRNTVRVVHEHRGSFKIEGDGGNKETFKFASQSVQTQTTNEVIGGLRQAIRKR
ncbi:tape measure protein [Cytobacillus firmus]|uniref:tape measure protein n=1 Tax=Cytobacillus firmus TaxID=1399 RepID=UPI003850014D